MYHGCKRGLLEKQLMVELMEWWRGESDGGVKMMKVHLIYRCLKITMKPTKKC
jgi:hypothetical protein